MILTENTPTNSDATSAWRTQFDDDLVPHVLPMFGPKHELGLCCWCHPVVDREYVIPAISHNVAQ